MTKYIILKHEYPNGQIEYEVQKKLFGLIWWNFNNIDSYETGLYDTLEKAENAIKIDMKKRKTTVVKTYN